MAVIPDSRARAQFQQRLRATRLRRIKAVEPQTAGATLAETVIGAMGSARFLAVQTLAVAGWITFNLIAIRARFDPYPFILLNLMFSTQASYAGPLILLAEKRSAARERRQADVTAQEVAELYQMGRTQLEMIRIMHEILQRLEQHDRRMKQQEE